MELISTHPIKQSDLGFNGTLFGGELLKWCDGDAVSYAMQYCDTPSMVTVLIDKCVFQKAGKPGQLIKTYAEAIAIGNTSITLSVESRSHNVRSGKQQIILSTNIKFVKIDEYGTPVPISSKVKSKFKKEKEVKSTDSQ